MAAFRAALVCDDTLREQANQAGQNYWPAYYAEVLRRMGLPHETIPPDDLTPVTLAEFSVLLLPPLPEGHLSPPQLDALGQWTEGGGLLVGFAAADLDELFGITVEGRIEQAGDEFSPSACLRLCDEQWTAPLLRLDERGLALPVTAPVRLISAPGARELARLLSFFEQDLRRPAVTYRKVGDGAACYWAFDLAHCCWAMHQGRPVYEDYDGDGWLRTVDMVPTRPWDAEVPYADLMMFTLRRIIAEHGGVFLHQLPPGPDGSISDALFHWGGDDEGAADVQVPAAEFMAGLGLPYHVNIMPLPPGVHNLAQRDFERLKALGCETSVHFNFITHCPQPYSISRDALEDQLRVYQQAYGETPVCTVFHCLTWTGWAEPARWLAELGLKGDNNRAHWRYPPINPVNRVNFAFGTAYPFHYWDDHTEANRRIPFTSQPITAYECGYRAGAGLEPSRLHRAVELAAFWNLTMSMFYHPIYLTGEDGRGAVQEALAHISRLDLNALHMGSDGLCLWWHARDGSAVEEVERGQNCLRVTTRTDYPAGCIVQVLAPAEPSDSVMVDGSPAVWKVREQHGARWLLVAVPPGRVTAMVTWAGAEACSAGPA